MTPARNSIAVTGRKMKLPEPAGPDPSLPESYGDGVPKFAVALWTLVGLAALATFLVLPIIFMID